MRIFSFPLTPALKWALPASARCSRLPLRYSFFTPTIAVALIFLTGLRAARTCADRRKDARMDVSAYRKSGGTPLFRAFTGFASRIRSRAAKPATYENLWGFIRSDAHVVRAGWNIRGCGPLSTPGFFDILRRPNGRLLYWLSTLILIQSARSNGSRGIGCKMSKVLYCAMSVMIISPFSTVTRLIWIASWL